MSAETITITKEEYERLLDKDVTPPSYNDSVKKESRECKLCTKINSDDLYSLPCGHSFHKECLGKINERRKAYICRSCECPECKSEYLILHYLENEYSFMCGRCHRFVTKEKARFYGYNFRCERCGIN